MWMGHRDHGTTLIYAHFAPDPSNGRVWAAAAFGNGAPGDAEDADATFTIDARGRSR
jgi:hypothetical protein